MSIRQKVVVMKMEFGSDRWETVTSGLEAFGDAAQENYTTYPQQLSELLLNDWRIHSQSSFSERDYGYTVFVLNRVPEAELVAERLIAEE